MACILNLETSTTNCSVALSQDGELIALKEDNNLQYSHSERLHLYIDEVINTAQVYQHKIDAVAVSMGPGSYTGLRIGVSAAKGLCFALGLPLIAVPTLEVLARKINVNAGCIVPMLDARRMEVYSQVFDAKHHPIEAISAQILQSDSYLNFLNGQAVYFVGNANNKAKTLINHPNANFESQLPSAEQMCGLSYKKFINHDFEDLAYFEPFYLKDFIATPPGKI